MGETLKYDTSLMKGYINSEELERMHSRVEIAHDLLVNRNGEGSDFLGWMDLPEEVDSKVIADIEKTAEKLRKISDYIVIVGIGGSYLGARATIESLSSGRDEEVKILFPGYNMSGHQMADLVDFLRDKDFSVNMISKSGTTTEPAIAFRMLESLLIEKYGANGAKERIVCTTDKEKGALRKIADKKGYKSFVIPDDVGGRFSVLTPVGLVPIACSGIDIKELLKGAKDQRKGSMDCDLETNLSYRYAAIRHMLYRKGKRIEVLASFDSGLHYVDEWWKQLFGESEGKSSHSIFPASCDFSTDLHSMGQLIQEGERNIFETFIIIDEEGQRCEIPFSKDDEDNLNYIAGKQLDYVNKKAYEATAEAHFEGGVPNSAIILSKRSPYCLGRLFYFFEKAVAVSAYISGVNPFNQPGVESYKNKMFKLLGKPSS